MRDTSDMMEDALSEDTMMDCGGEDGGLEDFVDLTSDVADNSSTIRDAAERLLTLLGMDEINEDPLSSSEDEGVEVDIDELGDDDDDDDDEDDDEETENAKLLHQLAASLAQELKYSQQRAIPSSFSSSPATGRAAHQGRGSALVEMLQSTSYHDRGYSTNPTKALASVYQNDFSVRDNHDERNAVGRTRLAGSCGSLRQDRQQAQFGDSFGDPKDTVDPGFAGYMSLDRRLRMEDDREENTAGAGRSSFGQQHEQDADTWAAGWNACATEAVRYLVEDEGLPLHHPAVVAMKSHLDLQREKAYAQHTTGGYTEAKSQDMSLALD